MELCYTKKMNEDLKKNIVELNQKLLRLQEYL